MNSPSRRAFMGNTKLGLLIASIAAMAQSHSTLPTLPQGYESPLRGVRRAYRSRWTPHRGAKQVLKDQQRIRYRSPDERRLDALKSMLDKGLEPCFSNGHSEMLLISNLKRPFPMSWLKALDYKGWVLNPWGVDFNFGTQQWEGDEPLAS